MFRIFIISTAILFSASDFARAQVVDAAGTAEAFNNEGLEALKDKNFEIAIKQFTAAVDLDKKYAVGYNNRGSAWRWKGDDAKALIDFNKAIEVRPNYSLAYRNRGLLYFDQLRLNESIADFSRSIELNPQDYRAILFLYLARAKKGDDPKPQFKTQANNLDFETEQWPMPLIALYRGNSSVAEIATWVDRSSNLGCAADFFVGQWHLLQSQQAKAISKLKAAVKGCDYQRMEHGSAISELKRLGQ